MPNRPYQPGEPAPRRPPLESQGLPRPGRSSTPGPAPGPALGPALGPGLGASLGPKLGPTLELGPTPGPRLGPTLGPKLAPTLGPKLAKIALVAAAASASLAANWLRWINPFVDSGREMNVPARLAAGERLYRDVSFYYGPAGPWLQALVLRLSGTGRRLTWLPLEIACLALAAAILFLLYRLAAAAGGPGSALAATALAAAFCLGAPHGGAFIFPYSASSLYALAGGLLALVASLRPPGWRRRLLVAGGLALALAARAEIGGAAALILLLAALRSRPVSEASRSALAAVADLALGAGAAVAIYGAAFAGATWRVLLTEGPLTHVLAMPPEWQSLYGNVSGLAHLDRSLPQLAWGLALDAVLLLACAWPASDPLASGRPRAAAPEAADPAGGVWPRILPRLAFCAAVAAGIAACSFWGGRLPWRWAGLAGDLPPVLFPLPLVAAAAALAALRRPLDARGRARFLLFGLAAALASRVLLGCKIGPAMTAYCALPLPPLLATAGVLGGDLLAPRLRNPGGFRFRFLALAVGLAGLYLVRVGALAWGPHVVWLDTAAGSLRLPWKEATAVAGTLDYLAGRARPGDRLACFPEAGFFNFVTGLPNPLRQEQIFPGILGGGREAEAVARLLAARPRFVLLANRPTPEFGPRAFGEDYAAGLWSAVEDHYSIAATFGNAAEGAPIGARRFFIRVYEPDPAPAGQPAASGLTGK